MILAFPNGFILNIQINAATKKSFQSLINPLAMFLARALNKVVLFFFFFFFFLRVGLRTCLHGGEGPHVGEVTRLGGVTCLSI